MFVVCNLPELPEVETTVRGLNNKVLSRTFVDVWTDFKKMVKRPESFGKFKKQIKGKKIQRIWRRGKNIIFELSDGYSLLIHQKLTGHLLVGKWQKKGNQWNSFVRGPLSEDPMNRFLHLIFWLDDDNQLALSDLRKFAKVELWKTKELKNSKQFKSLGPEPLEKSFTFEKFKEVLKSRRGRIKQVLMNQEVIVGVGNIYSDEALWRAKIHPFKDVSKLRDGELKKLYKTVQDVFKKAIELQGESISDYRTPEGRKGKFDKMRKVYRREGEKCSRCGTKIKRQKIGGRSTCFCPKCQRL